MNIAEGLDGLKRARALVDRAEREKNPHKRKAKARQALREAVKAGAAPGARKAARAIASRATRAMFQDRLGRMASVNAKNLVNEAEWACKFLVVGRQAFLNQEWHTSLDSFFKAAVIATNIVFTANTHDIQIPDKVVDDMNQIIHDSTHGIKKIIKVAMAKGLVHHEEEFHKKQDIKRRGAAPFVRKLMEVGG